MSLEIPSWRHKREDERPQIDEPPFHDRLPFVSDSVPALLSYIDSGCRYRVCNRAYSEWFGLSRENVIGKTMQEVLGDQAWKTLQPHVNEVLSGRPTQFETQAKYKRGGPRWIRVSYTPDVDGDGRVLGFAVLVTDISEYRRAEEALRHSEQFSRTIIESSRDCIKVVSLDGVLLWMSEASQKILCIDDIASLLGTSWLDFWHGEDQASARKAIEAAVRGGSGTFVGLFRVRNQPKWWEVVISPIMDLSGKPEKLLIVSRDVTERKRADEALRESEVLLQKAVSAKTVGVLFFDLNGHITNANETFERMSGYTREELRKTPHWEMLTSPEFLEATTRAAENLATKGETPPYEKRMNRKDGSRWWGLFAPIRLSGIGRDSECMEFIIDITEHKQAERALRESERRFRSFVEATAHVIWRTNARGEVDQPIPSWNAFTGQTESEAYGFGWMSAIHSDDRAKVAAAWQKANAEKGTYDVEYRLKIHSGEWRHVRARGVPVFDSAGNIAEYIGTCMDVTERQLAEERFQQLAENIPQLAWMVNADGWIFWFNKRWFEYTGTTLEQMRGWGWQAVHHPDHSERVTASWLQAMKTGEPWENTFPLRGKDGNYRWFLSRAFPIRDAEGNIVRWFGTNTDITEWREAEAALAEREAVLRTVTNEARVGLVMVNEEQRYLFVNQTYADIFGLTDASIIGQRVQDVRVCSYEDQIKPRLDRAFQGERSSYELHLANHPKYNEERFYEVTYEPRESNRGRYVVVVLMDITERKKAQEILERMVNERTAALRESNEQMEAFTYTIAHDLRAPLRGQQGFARALLEDHGPALGETGREYAERIIQSAVRMNNLISDLLAYSRLSQTEMRVEKIDLRKLVLEICEEMTFQIRDAGAKVQVDPFDFIVCGHQLTLRTSIQNLITNALKFTKPGVPPEVRIRAEERGRFVRLWVEDNGIGISPEHHRQVFGVFQRLHKIGQYPGTGVGLAIVQKGIERMGGRVGVESEEGAGSRFWLELERPE